MGEALCDDRPLTFDDLVADFDRGFKPKSEFRVGSEHEKFVFRIPGHGTVPYEGVMQIMGALNASGFTNIGLVTEQGGPRFDGPAD